MLILVLLILLLFWGDKGFAWKHNNLDLKMMKLPVRVTINLLDKVLHFGDCWQKMLGQIRGSCVTDYIAWTLSFKNALMEKYFRKIQIIHLNIRDFQHHWVQCHSFLNYCMVLGIFPRSHYLLVANQGLEPQTPDKKLVCWSSHLNNLTALFRMDIANVTLKQNIFVFQLQNEELCIYIEVVSVLTK